MSNEQIIEGNKLIAVFMGYEVFAKHCVRIADNMTTTIELWAKYHTSWNWLIPVVEKIESIEDKYHGRFGVYIGSNSCTIQATNFRCDNIPNPPYYFNSITLESKISSTWYSVGEFIKWYNQIK